MGDRNGYHVVDRGDMVALVAEGAALFHRDDLHRDALITQAVVLALPRPYLRAFPGYNTNDALDAMFSDRLSTMVDLWYDRKLSVDAAEHAYAFARYAVWFGMTTAWAMLHGSVSFPSHLFPPDYPGTHNVTRSSGPGHVVSVLHRADGTTSPWPEET
jgi:hypothetical protein